MDGFKAAERTHTFEGLLEEGKLLRVVIDGKRYLIPSAFEAHFIKETPPPRGVRILAPLDNLLWDRRMISEIFGFDYRWEDFKRRSEKYYLYE